MPACPHKAAAKDAGERHYFTGVPCKNGHVANRFTSCGACVECQADKVRRHREANPQWWADKERRYRAANPEAVKASQKRWKKKNPDKVAAKYRRWREKNPDKAKANCSRWYQANRDEAIAKVLIWRKENPETAKRVMYAAKQARRARQRGAEGSYSLADVERITKQQHGRCACCGNKRKLTVDHITPLAKGGSNWPSNLQMLCRPCNSSKNAKDPIVFAQERGMLL